MSCSVAKAPNTQQERRDPWMDQPFTQEEEIDIDFRVSGWPHAVVKQAENFRVQELVRKIESDPHREALEADLQQNKRLHPIQHQFESDGP